MFAASRLVCVIHQQPSMVADIAYAHLKSLGAPPPVQLKHFQKWWQFSHFTAIDKRRDARRVPVNVRPLYRALQHHFVEWLSGHHFNVLCSTCACKCFNDACLDLHLALDAAQVTNIADFAEEQAAEVGVSSQEVCEYLP